MDASKSYTSSEAVHLTGFIGACLSEHVYRSMFTGACLSEHVYRSMFIGACLLFYNGHLPLNLFFVASLHRLNTVGSLCGFLHQNKVRGAFCEKSVLGSEADLARYFFISIPPKALWGAVFGKRILQNLVVKELRSQNIENRRLKPAWIDLTGPSLPRP